jgi:hypothetical protein
MRRKAADNHAKAFRPKRQLAAYEKVPMPKTAYRVMGSSIGVEGAIMNVADLFVIVGNDNKNGKQVWRLNSCCFPVYKYEYEHEFG